MRVLILVLNTLLIKQVYGIVGGEPAPAPPEDDPLVFTRFAGKTAQVRGVREQPHYVFRSVRFGQAPIGRDRFLRPRQYFLQGFENATVYPPPCVQPVPGQDRVVGSEDCLFLNVFTPTLPTGMEGLPVIVWVHGGGFRYGSASQYGVRHLVGKQVVVVTIQYRLGSLGFLSTGSKELPGNAALWDMVLAVQWVRNYIGFFGGNPHRIVVMGHGTGASSAMLVALSNVAKGMSSGVVAMSGSSVSNWAVDDTPQDTARHVADQNGCPMSSTVTMIKCLQNLSPSSIIRSDSHLEFQRVNTRGFVSGLGGQLGCAPVNEGRYDGRFLRPLVEHPPMEHLFNNPQIPLLTGITRDETKRACHGQYKDEIINNLQTVPNFLDNVLVKNLQKSLRLVGVQNQSERVEGLLGALDPLQFRNYLQVKKNDLQEGVMKISEATGDALFNVPAFLTAQTWGRNGAPSFLYRFDHIGKRSKGHHFLKGLPLVGNNTLVDAFEDTVGHGDELAYLFDVQDLEGRPLESSNPINEDDNKVRDIFAQMITDFARFGKVSIEGQSVKPFSMSDNNFVQIAPKPKIANNFRYCEMALWCGLAQRLQSSTCQFLHALDSQVKNVQAWFDTVKPSTNKSLTGGLNLGDLPSLTNNKGIPGLNLGGIPSLTNANTKNSPGGLPSLQSNNKGIPGFNLGRMIPSRTQDNTAQGINVGRFPSLSAPPKQNPYFRF